MRVNYNYLLNFSASFMGGGLKRLQEYAKWFSEHGGARFIIHPQCEDLVKFFSKNEYFIIHQTKYNRIFNDCEYLLEIRKAIGQPDLYYSYGIPIYNHFGKLNWFHLSNVLPLDSKGIPLTLYDKYLRLNLLGWKIKKNYRNADFISAESQNSLNLIKSADRNKFRISVNGSDDELAYLDKREETVKENIAVILGTHRYKALLDSYQVFKFLLRENHGLTLVIIGDKETVPKNMLSDERVKLMGVLPRVDVVACLKRSRFYISTTMVENSYNAASEGIVFADTSYISDIGPHRELLKNEPYDSVSVSGMERKLLCTHKEDITGRNMKSWDDVITCMNEIVQSRI